MGGCKSAPTLYTDKVILLYLLDPIKNKSEQQQQTLKQPSRSSTVRSIIFRNENNFKSHNDKYGMLPYKSINGHFLLNLHSCKSGWA